MKKIGIAVGVVLVLYVIAALAACLLMPQRIADAEARNFGVRVAIARLTKDQWIVGERIRTITAATLEKGQSKIAEVSALLADPDLNHIALTYMGADWSVQRSSFLGQVAHARGLLNKQKKARDERESRLDKKIRELEKRKMQLKNQMQGSPSVERAWRIEMDDIDRQLAIFRTSNTRREYMDRDDEDKLHLEADAKSEDNVFKLATQTEQATVGALQRVMAEKLGELRWEDNETVRLRRAASFFNVWPFSLMMKLPVGSENEKRL